MNTNIFNLIRDGLAEFPKDTPVTIGALVVIFDSLSKSYENVPRGTSGRGSYIDSEGRHITD
jgi:hypothetical protein